MLLLQWLPHHPTLRGILHPTPHRILHPTPHRTEAYPAGSLLRQVKTDDIQTAV